MPFSSAGVSLWATWSVFKKMKAVCDLGHLGHDVLCGVGIFTAAIPAHDLDTRMSHQPGRELVTAAVRQQVDHVVLLQVDQNAAVGATAAEGSGKGMVLPPFPPLRTGLVPFDTSGSSLSFRRCYPTGFLNSQSGSMELVMTRGMQQEAICHII